jgi:hypothetical protein
MGPDGIKQLAQIERASADDAHSNSGNFDAGLGPTTLQGSHNHVERKKNDE